MHRMPLAIGRLDEARQRTDRLAGFGLHCRLGEPIGPTSFGRRLPDGVPFQQLDLTDSGFATAPRLDH